MANLKVAASPAFVFSCYGDEADHDDYIDVINRTADLGFGGLGLETFDQRQFRVYEGDKVYRIRDRMHELGLVAPEFVACSTRELLVSLDPEIRKRGIDEFKRIVDICAKLEVVEIINLPAAFVPELIKDYTPTYPSAPPDRVIFPSELTWSEIWDRYVSIVAECVRLAEDAGFRVGYEPVPCSIVPNTDAFLRLAGAVGSNSLGMVLDAAHLFVQKDILPVTVEKLGQRLLNVHVCDNDGRVDNHWAPGKGDIDWEGFLASLIKIGYSNWLSMEINVAEDPNKTYAESKEFVEGILSSL